MAQSPAHVVLQAVQLATDADVPALRQLTAHYPETLKLDLILRILLTYLPESIEPPLYTGFLRDLLSGRLTVHGDDATPPSLVEDLSDNEARHQVRKLHLLPLTGPLTFGGDSSDSFTCFLMRRAHLIEAETGSLPLLQQLLEPFLDHSDLLRTWVISTLLPLLRLDYEYYPQTVPSYSLEAFEKLEGTSAVNALLSPAARQGNQHQSPELGRDLRGLVGPWIYGETLRKRRKLDRRRSSSIAVSKAPVGAEEDIIPNTGWDYVNEWILNLSLRDFSQAVHAVEQWEGPRDVDYGGWDDDHMEKDETVLRSSTEMYAQTGLAAIYASHDTSGPTFEGAYSILEQVAHILDVQTPPELRPVSAAFTADLVSSEYLMSLSQAHLRYNAFLHKSNPITKPSKSSMDLLYLLLVSACTLESIGLPMACRGIADLSLFGKSVDQRTVFRKLLHSLQATKAREEKTWARIRQQLLWLRDWSYVIGNESNDDQDAEQGVFCKIGKVEFEIEILKAFLIGTRYKLALDIYCRQSQPIPLHEVEKAAQQVALTAYDNASNGNRSRGGVKRASDILASFGECFSESRELKRMSSLLSASHALSFYTLTLQHGVPFQPVNIRVHPDPISLIGKVLNQNPRSYTKLDDLLDIGRHLVRACVEISQQEDNLIPPIPEEQQMLIAERRIMAMAIDAALAENDFDTAYTYVVNRLAPLQPPREASPGFPGKPTTQEDDISWRAAYQAGRHQPPTRVNGPSKLRRLEQRMELLSQALLLAPSPALEEVLATWRRCEEDMNVLVAQETEDEEKWDNKGDRKIPGGFSGEDPRLLVQKAREPTRGAMNEEAPMGLFDVARGAAAALSKSAFPLRNPLPGSTNSPIKEPRPRPVSITSEGASDQDSLSGAEGEGRIRKRDMVSNMVAGGLASGIGWVLGAPPVRHE